MQNQKNITPLTLNRLKIQPQARYAQTGFLFSILLLLESSSLKYFIIFGSGEMFFVILCLHLIGQGQICSTDL